MKKTKISETLVGEIITIIEMNKLEIDQLPADETANAAYEIEALLKDIIMKQSVNHGLSDFGILQEQLYKQKKSLVRKFIRFLDKPTISDGIDMPSYNAIIEYLNKLI